MITAKELYYTHHNPRGYENKKNVVYLCKKFERVSFGIFVVCKVTIGSKREQVYRELGFKEES